MQGQLWDIAWSSDCQYIAGLTKRRPTDPTSPRSDKPSWQSIIYYWRPDGTVMCSVESSHAITQILVDPSNSAYIVSLGEQGQACAQVPHTNASYALRNTNSTLNLHVVACLGSDGARSAAFRCHIVKQSRCLASNCKHTCIHTHPNSVELPTRCVPLPWRAEPILAELRLVDVLCSH